MADRLSRRMLTPAGAIALGLAAAVLCPSPGRTAAMTVPTWLGWLPEVALVAKEPGLTAPAGGATAHTPEPSRTAEVGEVEAPPVSASEPEPSAPLAELNEALAAAKAKLEELSKAAEIANEVSALRARIRALEQDRARLVAALEQAETARDAAEENAHRARDELRLNQAAIAEGRTREAQLVRSTEQSATELAEVRQQLAATEAQLANAEESQEQAVLRAAELQALLGQTRVEVDRERDGARAESGRLQASVAALEKQLAEAKAEADALRADKERVDKQLALLQEAASSATKVARQNLIAVEEKVQLLHSALGEPPPAPPSDDSTPGHAGAPASNAEAGPEGPDAGDDDVLPPLLKPATTDAAGSDLAGIKASGSGRAGGSVSLAEHIDALPLEMRLQARSLLADLGAKSDARGLLMTVPGEKLFATDSDEIGVAAHDTLAKIAEIIGIYDNREVLITGHTDGFGQRVYNRMLSERRADLIRTFFVDNFGIEADRLKTQGQGEDHPLASNATNAGRKANRRVEVLIMD
jgi:outer membrane protein OmpA-like peptidoglycan-associated protein